LSFDKHEGEAIVNPIIININKIKGWTVKDLTPEQIEKLKEQIRKSIGNLHTRRNSVVMTVADCQCEECGWTKKKHSFNDACPNTI